MELFFNNSALPDKNYVEFDLFETQHLAKSLRKKSGEKIHFTDGKGNLYSGKINKLKPLAGSSCVWLEYKENPEVTELAVGFIRHNRMDILIEKITELGVRKIHLFGCENTNYFTDNTTKWQKVARQAVKQSLRLHLPEINVFNNFEELVAGLSQNKNIFVADQFADKNLQQIDWMNHSESMRESVIIIGPEGGLSQPEMQLAFESGFTGVNFNRFRLRTETAAIAAVTLLNSAIK